MKGSKAAEVEKSFLGAVMIDPGIMDMTTLQPDDFGSRESVIFAAMVRLHSKHGAIDVVALGQELPDMPASHLMDLVDYVPTAANWRYYETQVKRHSLRRKLSYIGNSIAMGTGEPEDILSYAESSIFALGDTIHAGGLELAASALKSVFDRMEWASEHPGQIPGLTTGLSGLDTMIGGLEPGLFIIAGRPGTGKTSLALNMAEALSCGAKIPTCVFSLEMTRERLVNRMVCALAKVDQTRAKTGLLEASEYGRLMYAAQCVKEAPLYIDDTPAIRLAQFRSRARRAVKSGAKALFVDYLQLMTNPRSENRLQEVSVISRGLQATYKELKVPVIALSQLNRGSETRADKRPTMSDLRESGQIEQDADVIMFTHHDKENGRSFIFVEKNRDGNTGPVEVVFDKHFTRFREV